MKAPVFKCYCGKKFDNWRELNDHVEHDHPHQWKLEHGEDKLHES